MKIAHFDRERNGDTQEGFCINGQTVPTESGEPIPQADCNKDRVRAVGAIPAQYTVNVPNAGDGTPYLRDNFTFLALTVNGDMGPFDLVSTSGFYSQISQGLTNLDNAPSAAVWVAQRERYQLVTQEARLNSSFGGPVQVSLGAYYENSQRKFTNAAQIFNGFDPVGQNYVASILSSRATDEYVSAFGQLRWNLLPELELAGGARWSQDRKTTRIQNLSVNPAFSFLLPVGRLLRGTYSDSHVSPEASLTWHPSPEQTLYVSYKTGYKAGGLSNAFLPRASDTPDSLLFAPEVAKGFEVGFKAKLFDRHLRFDIEAYRYNYSDLQVVSFVPPVNIQLTNAASSRIMGVQGSAELAATETLTLRGNFGYNSAKYRAYPRAPCYTGQTAEQGCLGSFQDLSGQRLYLAPELTFSLGGEFRPDIIAGWRSSFSAQATHSSSFNASTSNAPGGLQSAYWLLNAGVRVGPDDESFEVALIGRNLTNTYYLQFANSWTGGSPNQYAGDFARPREISLQATVRW